MTPICNTYEYFAKKGLLNYKGILLEWLIGFLYHEQ